jgi:CHAD domain-containing protein
MKALLEREVKLAPPPDLDLSELDGESAAARDFDSTYYDTESHDLLRHRVTFRRRVEGDSAAWQLKLPGADGRHELEFEDGELPPDEALRLVFALTRRAPVAPVARLRTHRTTVRINRGDVHVADVVLDAVTVLDGERVGAAFDELEVELMEGEEDDLRRLEGVLRNAGAVDAEGPSKLARVLGAETGQVRPAPAGSPAEVLVAALRSQLKQLLAHDPGTRTGLDPEDLHQFRVATRRLLAFLRAARSLVEEQWADDLRAELAWLGGLLGAVRDGDVLIERLRAEAGELDDPDREALEELFDALGAEREAARVELLAGLESDRYLELLGRLESEVPVLAGADDTLAAIWERAYRRARKAVNGLDAVPTDEALHAARIRVKRARYAAELAEPELGKRGAGFVDAAKEFQDVVGAHQDAVVGEAVLRRLAPELPGAAFAMGRLVERERARRAAARAAWRDSWRRLERRAKQLGA